MHFIKTIALLFISSGLFAQQNTIVILDSGHKTSLRGLSVVNDNVLWASGSNGTVARSIDGGNSFEWITAKGYEQRDFRDVEAFDSNTALIMAIAEPAIILKTKNGGKSWYKVFEDTTKGMFLDAMDFDETENYGFVLGDPINKRFYINYTFNGGENWEKDEFDYKEMNIKPTEQSPQEGEAFFAASGTNIKIVYDRHIANIIYVSGGKRSRFFLNLSPTFIPLISGKESTGANSIAAWDINKMTIVGGDFASDKDTIGNCALSTDAGQTWLTPQTPPHGYRSCVAYITENKLITCGTSGVDISKDGGMNWQLISIQSFHVCQRAKKGTAVFLAGADGKIAKLE